MNAPSAHPRPASEREAERLAYLAGTEWRDAGITGLGSDASIRQYFRLVGGPSPALLMDAPSAATAPPCPPGAGDQERKALGYGALVRGSGSSLKAYDAASKMLAGRGVVVPSVLDADETLGFAVIEDLGQEQVAQAASAKDRERALYTDAADILEKLRAERAVPGEAFGWWFQTYDALAYETEAALLTEWYLPKIHGRTLSPEDVTAVESAWSDTFALLSTPTDLVHRDFHAENLMVCQRGIGVLDFQDLMIGQAAYDWASLLEDARRDLSADVRKAIYARGRDKARDPVAFETDYAVLAAQRNAKILGLFARLAHRDGKPRYLDLIPRVRRFFVQDLSREPLTEVRRVLHDLTPELFDG